MKELPSPAMPLVGLLERSRPRVAPAPSPAPVSGADCEPPFEIVWARHQDEVRAAQRLRWRVFVDEMGARPQVPEGTPPGLDVDRFDDFCEHLLVRTRATTQAPAEVIGTYRVLTPGAARRAGRLYSDGEFDLSTLQALRPRMIELGRSCVHAEHRSGGVILALWGALAAFMDGNGLDTMVGCASVGMRDGGHYAASLWARLRTTHLADAALQVRPHLPLPVDELDQTLAAEAPPLIRGYLRCGARLLGAPAWDPDFQTADLPLLMRLTDLPARYRRHFLAPV
jgi:putative hemolysin